MNWIIRAGQLGPAKKPKVAAGAAAAAATAADRLAYQSIDCEADFATDFITGFEPGMNAGVTTYPNCSVTSNSGHVLVQLRFLPQGSPNADKTTFPAKPAVWQHVLSILVGH
jgi:hypothetical protein